MPTLTTTFEDAEEESASSSRVRSERQRATTRLTERGPCRPLRDLDKSQVSKLLAQLGYGKYAIEFHMNGVDGTTLAQLPPEAFAELGITARPLQRILYEKVDSLKRRGVPDKFLQTSFLGTVVGAMLGCFSTPVDPDETLRRAAYSRQVDEQYRLSKGGMANEAESGLNGSAADREMLSRRMVQAQHLNTFMGGGSAGFAVPGSYRP